MTLCNFHQGQDKRYAYQCEDCMLHDVIEPEQINDIAVALHKAYPRTFIQGIGFSDVPF